MSPTAHIQFSQPGNVGTAGQALIGQEGTVSIANGSSAEITYYKFILLDGPDGLGIANGTVLAEAAGSVPVASFAWPEGVYGTAQIRLILNQTDIPTFDATTTIYDDRDFIVPTPAGFKIPAFRSTDLTFNYNGQDRGWSTALREIIDSIGGGTLAGNVTGTLLDTTVVAIQDNTVSATPPQLDDVLQCTAPGTLAFGPMPPAFAISSFSTAAGNLFELGQTVSSPVFLAAYNRLPSGANIGDGTNTLVLTTPFTSGTMAYSYTRSVNAQSYVFTLSAARGASNATATYTMYWGTRVYRGTSSNATGNTSGFITGLTSQAVALTRGGSFTVTASSGEYIYCALPESFGTPTFTIGGFTTTFTKVGTNVSVTNAYGVAVLYGVYRSNVTGLGATTVVVS